MSLAQNLAVLNDNCTNLWMWPFIFRNAFQGLLDRHQGETSVIIRRTCRC